MTITRDTLERDYALIEQAALSGERCPQANPHGPLSSNSMSALINTGRVRVEVFAHNFRRVTLLTGPHRGKCTASPSVGSKAPYKVIDRSGIRTDTQVGRAVHGRQQQMQQPSAPRPLPRDYFK